MARLSRRSHGFPGPHCHACGFAGCMQHNWQNMPNGNIGGMLSPVDCGRSSHSISAGRSGFSYRRVQPISRYRRPSTRLHILNAPRRAIIFKCNERAGASTEMSGRSLYAIYYKYCHMRHRTANYTLVVAAQPVTRSARGCGDIVQGEPMGIFAGM